MIKINILATLESKNSFNKKVIPKLDQKILKNRPRWKTNSLNYVERF